MNAVIADDENATIRGDRHSGSRARYAIAAEDLNPSCGLKLPHENGSSRRVHPQNFMADGIPDRTLPKFMRDMGRSVRQSKARNVGVRIGRVEPGIFLGHSASFVSD